MPATETTWTQYSPDLWRSSCDRAEIIRSEIDHSYTIYIDGKRYGPRSLYLSQAKDWAEDGMGVPA